MQGNPRYGAFIPIFSGAESRTHTAGQGVTI